MDKANLKEQILNEIDNNEMSDILINLINSGKLEIQSFRKVFPVLPCLGTNIPTTFYISSFNKINYDNDFSRLDGLCKLNSIAIRIESHHTDITTHDFGAVVEALFD